MKETGCTSNKLLETEFYLPTCGVNTQNSPKTPRIMPHYKFSTVASVFEKAQTKFPVIFRLANTSTWVTGYKMHKPKESQHRFADFLVPVRSCGHYAAEITASWGSKSKYQTMSTPEIARQCVMPYQNSDTTLFIVAHSMRAQIMRLKCDSSARPEIEVW